MALNSFWNYPKADYFKKCSLTTRHRADDTKWLLSCNYLLWHDRICWLVRYIFTTGEKTNEGPALLGGYIAYRAAQHRVSRLQRVKDRSLSNGFLNLKLYRPVHLSQ
jgi:hypothetical protein